MRKKLFDRKKLFSTTNEGGIIMRDLICKDCGYVLHTAESPVGAVCPNCGGRRMDIKLFSSTAEDNLESLPDSTLESKLKTYSGETMDKNFFTKTFSEDADSLIERGFAEKSGDSYKISEDAYDMQKLFSKLTISVTKTLELDPEIVNGDRENKLDVIDQLSHDHDGMPGKSIILLKKAHGIPLVDKSFSECGSEECWIEDSSIIPDLELEYNNQSFSLGQFIKILRDRYPDAPDNLIDILIDKGVLFIDGNQVTIHKK